MKRNLECSLLVLGIASFAAACDNPAVDPNATFEAQGTVIDSAGQPLANAEVRLVKYSSTLNIFEPSAENLFLDSPQNDNDVELYVSLVKTTRTDASGNFKMSFLGEDIAAKDGYTTAEGLVEVANTILVVRDPSMDNTEKRAGVYTYPYTFQQSNRLWGPPMMALWNADATADTGRALTAGLIDFSWKKLERLRTTDVRNAYRVDIGEEGSPSRLIIRCSEGGMSVEGGCSMDSMDATRLTRAISAYSVLAYYSDNNGMFAAYVRANGADNRHIARFRVTAPVPDLRDTREEVGIEGVWAVGTGEDQNLLATPATDGDPSTRQLINNNAKAIYAKLTLASVSDAGLLNSLVKDASTGCVVLEFSVNDFSNIAAAKASGMDAWTQTGKFCGENGGRGEVSALAGFDTTSQNGVTAAWMRLRATPDGGGDPYFQAVGEIAVFKKK